MIIPLGPWRPDAVDLDIAGEARVEEATNVYPRGDGYDSMPDTQTFGTSVTASSVLSAYSARDITANGYTFCATDDHLYKQSATGAWDAVNRTASYAAGVFQFAGFGNTLLAVNGVDAMQAFTLGTSSQFLDQSASASAPIAAVLAVVQNFVVAGRIQSALNRVQWSHINNARRWGRSAQNQSDAQDFPGDGGNIVAITGGDFGCILTNRSLIRMSYIGAPFVFRFDELAPNTGCLAAGSVARYQGFTFFLSGNGFMMFDGQQAVSIGDETVDDWFFDNVDANYYSRMTAAIDPDRKLYVLSFVSVNSPTGTPDRLLIYNFESRRWTNATQSLDCLFSGMARGAFTLEQLDSFGTLDSLPHSLDSDFWGGPKQNVLAGFSTGHVFLTFDSTTARGGIIITSERQFIAGHRALVTELRPIVQGNSSTVISARVGTRDTVQGTVAYGNAVAMNAWGIVPLRSNARYQRIRLDVTGGFERMHAVEVRAAKVGRR